MGKITTEDEEGSESSVSSNSNGEDIANELSYMEMDDTQESPSRRVVEDLARRVVYRSSSPCSTMTGDHSKNVLQDFNSDMNKGMLDL